MIELQSFILKLFLAALLGALIGYEREIRRREGAGIRTHALICLGATILTLISMEIIASSSSADPERIIASIVTAAGFIGAGAIIAARGEIHGLTTAASVWVVTSVGILIAFGNYFYALIATIFIFAILELWRLEVKLELKPK